MARIAPFAGFSSTAPMRTYFGRQPFCPQGTVDPDASAGGVSFRIRARFWLTVAYRESIRDLLNVVTMCSPLVLSCSGV